MTSPNKAAVAQTHVYSSEVQQRCRYPMSPPSSAGALTGRGRAALTVMPPLCKQGVTGSSPVGSTPGQMRFRVVKRPHLTDVQQQTEVAWGGPDVTCWHPAQLLTIGPMSCSCRINA